MPNPHTFSNVLSLRKRIDNQIITNTVYTLIFSYLILFSIINSLYNDTPRPSEIYQPQNYDIDNVVVKSINCTFPISGQYESTTRYICYVLLILTIVIRNHEWLAAGAAAWVLTYSGIAAIHMIILFTKNQRLYPSKLKSHCELLPISDESPSFVACAGVNEPDVGQTMNIVSAVMLGALPAAAWSTTFKRSSSKAILIFWLLLLAVGHSFFALIIPNQNFHFQICHKDHTESPLQANYQAPYLDQSWRDSFYTLTSTARNYSQIPENGSLPDCIYSCFATSSYTGRKTQDIMVIDNVSDRDSFQALRNNRGTIILFWWAYTFLAFVTFFITEKKTYLPQWVHKQLFSIRYRRKSSASGWKWKTVTNSTIKAAKNSTVTDVLGIAPFIKINITVLKVLHIISQLIGLFAFLGCIIYQETGNIQLRNAESQESFAAVGQWGNVATVLLVLAAAMISRLWTGRGTRSDGALSGGRTCITGDTKLERGDDEDGDMETGKEDWDWRVGYAS